MASSLYSNAQHVDFESVLGMDDPGMVSMFEALVASGLRGFLGCPAIVYEDALVDFFENASVRSGVIISTVGGQLVEISEKLFAETFELPIDGFGDLSEMPKDAIFDARSIVYLSGEPISLSRRKNQMKMPFRLLCDNVAKAISVKAGSFNAITVEKFSLITAVVCKIKMDWAKFLFGVLKKMVSVGSKQAKGFAIQISVLLATFPSVELGESSEFPASKILSKKTVLRFVSINDRDGAEEVTGAAKKKAVSKKRPAADVGAAVPKKKRTSKKKSISSISSLELVEGSTRDRGSVIARNNTNTRSSCWIRTMILVDGVWTVEPCADKWVKIPRKVVSTEVPRQRQYDDTLPTMSLFFKLLRKRWADVCVEVVEFCASPRLLPIGSIQFCRSLQLAEPVSSFASSRPTVFALRFSQFCSVFIDLSLFSWLQSPDISEFLSSIALDRTILRSVQRSQDSFAVAPSVQLSLELHQSSSSSDSSSSLHFDQTDIDATASSRPPISPDFSADLADFQAALSEQMFAFQSEISSRMHKIEKSVCDSLRDQAYIFKNLSQGARQEVRTIDDVHTIRFNEFRKNVLTQNASIFQGLSDVRQVVDAVNAKVDIMASRINDIQKGC
ncbi:dystroglycan-like [Dorcoceras hygrometricum]|uniref:Dystroglycan-like n=1 Tax=Dorcoceras hygrometricum TaxID=472368 RepID=A0A2Z7ARU2_9LAMI|nr:dystroglycan-like [Dorcoceras hygrometricum]